MKPKTLSKIKEIKKEDFYLTIQSGGNTFTETKQFSSSLAIDFITIKLNELITAVNNLIKENENNKRNK